MSCAAKSPMITVSAGLLDPRHLHRMGSALAEFLCLVDWQTDKSGTVRGGAPVKIQEIADRLGRSRRSVERNLGRLANYIEIRRTSYGLIFKIKAAKKRFRRRDTNVVTGADNSVVSRPRCDESVATNLSQTKKTTKKENTVEQKLDGSRRVSYPDWFERFWKAYPPERGSKKAGYTHARKYLKSDSEVAEAYDLLIRKVEHIRAVRSSGKFAGNLPHVERYFSKGHWNQPLDTEPDPAAQPYGRPVTLAEVEQGNREIEAWKQQREQSA